MSPALLAVLGLIITLWLASMGAVWKVATLLSSITGELRDLRADTDRHALALADIRPPARLRRPAGNGPNT